MEWPAADLQHLLFTAAQQRGMERELIDRGLPEAALMERAGLGLSTALMAAPQRLRQGVVVLVGPGHNGGDGLVVARDLQLAGVQLRLWSPFNSHKPLTAEHLRQALWRGIPLLQQPPPADDPDLWLDALFGVGQQRPLPQAVARLLEKRHRAGGEIWSIDGPSGICSDSGQLLGETAARCSRTFVVGLWKLGLWQDAALPYVGQQQRIDLGFPSELVQRWGAGCVRGLHAADAQSPAAPLPTPEPNLGKHGRGRLRVIAGSATYPGAGRLALEGASATGLGWLEGCLPPSQAELLWQLLPHVLLRNEEEPPERLDAVVFGPGLGAGELPQGLVQFPGLLLLDADGLNRLAATADASGWLQRRQGATWITPHRAECDRVFPDLSQLSPLDKARVAAQHSGAWVLLKGAHSLIASPNGSMRQLLHSSPWAARAGLGDVLAGYAGGLGALAVACRWQQQRSEGWDGLLALAGLRHALAGELLASQGEGKATPLAVAQQLSCMDYQKPLCEEKPGKTAQMS
jgi:NAD(P)H-hydrate epimerase